MRNHNTQQHDAQERNHERCRDQRTTMPLIPPLLSPFQLPIAYLAVDVRFCVDGRDKWDTGEGGGGWGLVLVLVLGLGL